MRFLAMGLMVMLPFTAGAMGLDEAERITRNAEATGAVVKSVTRTDESGHVAWLGFKLRGATCFDVRGVLVESCQGVLRAAHAGAAAAKMKVHVFLPRQEEAPIRRATVNMAEGMNVWPSSLMETDLFVVVAK